MGRGGKGSALWGSHWCVLGGTGAIAVALAGRRACAVVDARDGAACCCYLVARYAGVGGALGGAQGERAMCASWGSCWWALRGAVACALAGARVFVEALLAAAT